MRSVTSFQEMKNKGEKIAMLTAYDYPSGKMVAKASADVILVGDSLGMVVLGYENTLQVTMDDIIHHTKAVRRGAPDMFIISDMPYRSFHLDLRTTKENAFRLIIEGGANAVKLEGGSESRLEAIRAIVDCEIPVVAHLGLTPQSVNKFGGYKVQGKDTDSSEQLFEMAKRIEEAGAFMVVLEGIPEALGRRISQTLKIPTIGIGAGRHTDGQVLVYHDLLGHSEFKPKFVERYENLNTRISEALASWCKDVQEKKFPKRDQVYFPEE